MDYGGFSADGREYIINRPDLPRPWINYLTNGSFCSLISQTGGGYSFWRSSGYDRITKKYPEETLLQDRPGRYVYLYDRDSKDYWSINWQPVCRNPVVWESRHGLGYSTIRSSYAGIKGEITYFVPLHDDLEIWWVRVRNDGQSVRNLQIFDFVEWSMGNHSFKLIESSFSKLFEEVLFEDGLIRGTMRFWNVAVGTGAVSSNTDWGKYVFMTAGLDTSGYDCLKEKFIGTGRNWSNPRAVTEGGCFNSHAFGKFSVGALQHTVVLPPGGEIEYTVLVGIGGENEKIMEMRDKYTDLKNAGRALAEVRSYWDDYIDRLVVDTPDADFNLSVNIWNKYQAWVTSHWARMDSYYIGGSSILGFRDSCQDNLGILPTEPERARDKLKTLLEHQFADGSCIHNWDPVSDTGPKTGHSDDPLWLVMAILDYIKESGDMAFARNEKIDFYDEGSDTVYQHLQRALAYTLSGRSLRGIPLIGAGDWNDGLDQVGRQGYGESVMVAEQLVWMLREAARLAIALEDAKTADIYRELADELAARINEACWDGEWYFRATCDDGRLLGSQQSGHGKIYLNSQVWAVISGTASEERAVKCMDAVAEQLDTDYGPALFLPAYSEPDPGIGIITRFFPGTKENGTIFNHPVCWAVIAECILGRGDRAYDIWRRNSFIIRGREPNIYKVEPYIYAEYVYGPDSEYYGEGEFSWTTGTAAWMWRACTDWIMGVRPELNGLLIDPCIPSAWKECGIIRRWRGALYDIRISNPDGICRGVQDIAVDGKGIEGRVLPDLRDGALHRVDVNMRRGQVIT